MKIKIIPLLISTLVGCGSDNSNSPAEIEEEMGAPEENIIVYISKGNTQCFGGGLNPTESAEQLTNVGIDVIETFCGTMTGVAFPAACGQGTGDILAHEIWEVNLATAIELGYEEIVNLIDDEDGTGYEIDACKDT